MHNLSEEKELYEKYKEELKNLKKVKKESNSVTQVFTKGLLQIYVLYILSLGPTNGNDISKKIGYRTKGLWLPSTGGIYPLLKKLEKNGFIIGNWDDPVTKFQKIYSITEKGLDELVEKKHLLKPQMENSLKIFSLVFKDLYN
ncbi:MAG: PadR family transcriptional regulator [Sarcina sp.]